MPNFLSKSEGGQKIGDIKYSSLALVLEVLRLQNRSALDPTLIDTLYAERRKKVEVLHCLNMSMRKLQLALVGLLVVELRHHGCGASFETRIVGGQQAVEGRYPYAVSLTLSSLHFCGGTFTLSESWSLKLLNSPIVAVSKYSASFSTSRINTAFISPLKAR